MFFFFVSVTNKTKKRDVSCTKENGRKPVASPKRLKKSCLSSEGLCKLHFVLLFPIYLTQYFYCFLLLSGNPPGGKDPSPNSTAKNITDNFWWSWVHDGQEDSPFPECNGNLSLFSKFSRKSNVFIFFPIVKY